MVAGTIEDALNAPTEYSNVIYSSHDLLDWKIVWQSDESYPVTTAASGSSSLTGSTLDGFATSAVMDGSIYFFQVKMQRELHLVWSDDGGASWHEKTLFSKVDEFLHRPFAYVAEGIVMLTPVRRHDLAFNTETLMIDEHSDYEAFPVEVDGTPLLFCDDGESVFAFEPVSKGGRVWQYTYKCTGKALGHGCQAVPNIQIKHTVDSVATLSMKTHSTNPDGTTEVAEITLSRSDGSNTLTKSVVADNGSSISCDELNVDDIYVSGDGRSLNTKLSEIEAMILKLGPSD